MEKLIKLNIILNAITIALIAGMLIGMFRLVPTDSPNLPPQVMPTVMPTTVQGGSVGDISIDTGTSGIEKKNTLSTADLAEIHGVNTDTVRRWLVSGKVRGAEKIGSKWVIPADYVLE